MTNKTKTIGLITEVEGKKTVLSKAFVTARFTSDKEGETLSLQAGDVQITVAFEPLAKMIKETRAMTK